MTFTHTATRIGINGLALLGAIVALYLGHSTFIPVVFAALLAVILWPAASWLHRKCHMPWFVACCTVIGLLVLVNIAVFVGFVMAVPQTLEQMPNPGNPAELRDLYRKSRTSLEHMLPNVDRVLPSNPDDSTAFAYVEKFLGGGYVTDQLVNLSKVGAAWFFQSIVILFILLFLLLEGEYLAERLKEMFGDSLGTRTKVSGALTEMAKAIRAYLIWRTIVNVGLGVFLGVVYSIVGLKQPWTWALFTAILCYVPYIGTIIAGFPPVIDALVTLNSPWVAMGVLIFYIGVVTIEGYIIVPMVMGRSMDLNATTVMIACLFWDLVWGTPGLFLAMPLMAGVRAVCMHVDGWMPWANLMSTEAGYKEAEEAKRMATIAAKVQDADATVIMEEPKD